MTSRMCPSRFWGPRAAVEWKPLPLWNIDLQVAQEWQFRQEADGACWWDERALCPAGAYYFDPPAASSVGKDLEVKTFPSPKDFNPSHELPDALLRRLEEDAKFLYENTGYAIACGEMIHDLQYRPGGTQSWWMQMVEEPDACHEFLGKAVDAGLAQLRQLDQAIGKYCEILGFADDMGDTRGITIGPDLWRQIYKPHYQRFFTGWHKLTRMKANLHTCGAMSDLLGDLVECGVDLYNPVQISTTCHRICRRPICRPCCRRIAIAPGTRHYRGRTRSKMKSCQIAKTIFRFKDIRLGDLADGRIGVFSRPRTDEIKRQFGSEAQIGFTSGCGR